MCALCLLSYIIDPIGIHESSIIDGLNNNKIKQAVYLDVFKPYQVARAKAKVIFIGSSRVYVGLKPSYPGYSDEDIYNMGASSLNLPDAEKYLNLIYSIYKPEKVILGLDNFQFTEKGHNYPRDGFSDDRINWLKRSTLLCPNKFFDDIRVREALKETFQASRAESNHASYFIRGWDVSRGDSSGPHHQTYYSYVNQAFVNAAPYKAEQDAYDNLQRIVDEAKRQNVELIVFFSPRPVDINLIDHISDDAEAIIDWKKKCVAIAGKIYDFYFISDYTLDRNNFYDASHYRAVLGDRMKQDMFSDCDTENMHILTVENMDEKLLSEEKRYVQWEAGNSLYATKMKQVILENKALNVGDLKDWIDF